MSLKWLLVLATLGKRLPLLKGPELLWRTLSISLVVVGVTLGILGSVRTCSILVALGGALYTYLSYTSSATKRTIELLLPMAMATLLFMVSFTLPHAK